MKRYGYSLNGIEKHVKRMNPSVIEKAKNYSERAGNALDNVFEPEKGDPHMVIVDMPKGKDEIGVPFILGMADAYASRERGIDPFVWVKDHCSLTEPMDVSSKAMIEEFVKTHGVEGFVTWYALESGGKGTKKFVKEELKGRVGNILGLRDLRNEEDLDALVNAWDIKDADDVRKVTQSYQDLLNLTNTVTVFTGENKQYKLIVDIKDKTGPANTAIFTKQAAEKDIQEKGTGKYGNMIYGEAYSEPLEASQKTNGQFEVVLFEGKNGAEFAKVPMVFDFKDGYVVEIRGHEDKLISLLEERKVDYPIDSGRVEIYDRIPQFRLDEIGIPTNPQAILMPHTMVSEKAGVHIALAEPHRDQIGKGTGHPEFSSD